jgi:two-component system nitrogen regulation response regulator NtrX
VQIARAQCPVLIEGESGVGKDLVAREIHNCSSRSHGPFVAINCSAIPETLIESELFGHEAGAFTDARKVRRGAFELSGGGTLFLDEIGALSPIAQPKLLRAIESGEVRRLGSEKPRQIDLRVVAATNQSLLKKRREGSFREDLYYRLDVVEINIPPLREHPEDIPELAQCFVELIARKNGLEPCRIRPDAMKLLMAHSWPGNVRELRSALERAMVLHPGPDLAPSCLTMAPTNHPGLTLSGMLQKDWVAARREFESAYVRDLLTRHASNVSAAARTAGLSRRGFHKIMTRLGLRARRPVP